MFSLGKGSVKFRLPYALFLILYISGVVNAQADGWQQPVLRSRTDIEKIMGPIKQKEPSRDLNIVWVWSIDTDHSKSYHPYDWIMDLYVNKLLNTVPRVTATAAMNFPSKQQWETADLVVFYFHAFDYWRKPQYDLIDAFRARGGGLIFIHESVIQRPGDELAKRIGLAWATHESSAVRKDDASQWGFMPLTVDVTSKGRKHPILRGFPEKIDFVEELYWDLRGDLSKVDVLVTSQGGPTGGRLGRLPKAEELDGKTWPVFFTMEERRKGKVFVSVPGHNHFFFSDPYFRIILLRAMAWTMNESFDPFKPLVIKSVAGRDFNVEIKED